MAKKKYGNVTNNLITVSTRLKTGYQVDGARRAQMQHNQSFFNKAQEQYNDILERITEATHISLLGRNSLIDSFVENPNELVKFLEENGIVDNNTILELVNDFESAYNLFFQVFAYSIEDIERIGEKLGDTSLRYGIGIYTEEAGLSMHLLEGNAKSLFIRDQSVFGIQQDKTGKFIFGVKENVGTSIVEKAIQQATGDSSGGVNLAKETLGENLFQAQQSAFMALSQARLQTPRVIALNEEGRLEKYQTYLDRQLAKNKITSEEYEKRLATREKQMEKTVNLSRKLEGSYRLLVEQATNSALLEDGILDQITKMQTTGYGYIDNIMGAFQGDLTKSDLEKLGITSPSDISLKLIQDQKYNPDLYSANSVMNIYNLMLDTYEMEEINAQFTEDSIIHDTQVQENIETVVGQYLGEEITSTFFDSGFEDSSDGYGEN